MAIFKKSWIRRVAAALLSAMLLLGQACPVCARDSGQPESGRVVTVAFPQIPGISETDQYGNHFGLMVDYLNEIAKYTGWKYNYLDTTGERLIDEFLAGRFDLMGGTYYSPEFEKYFAYPKYNMGNSKATLFCRMDDQRIKSYDLNTLKGMTIGVYQRANEKVRRLQEFLRMNDLNCELRYYTPEQLKQNGGNLYPYLERGEVDLLLGSEFEVSGRFRVAASFDAQAYYLVTNVGNDAILEGLNKALEKILDSDPAFAKDRYEENFKGLFRTVIPFNRRERAYIEKKKTVSVAVARDWHPFYCNHDMEEHHNGIIPDLLGKVGERSGLTFTYLYTDTYADAIRMVRTGEADLLGGFLDSNEAASGEGLVLTKAYVALNNIIVKNKATDFPSHGLVGGILEARRMPDSIEAEEVRAYATIKDSIDAVNRGEVDFIYGVSFSMEPEIQSRRYANIVPVARINNSTSVSMAMAGPADLNLLTILNKSIGSLSEAERDTIMDRNLVSMGYPSLTLREFVYANPFAVILAVAVFLCLAAAIVLMAQRVRIKNALMQSELEKAEAKSRAKSDFLSHMSHEIRTPMNAIMGLTDLACMEEKLQPSTRENLEKIHSSSQYLLSLINDILDMSRIENGKLQVESAPFSVGKLLMELEDMMGEQARRKRLDIQIDRRIVHDRVSGDHVHLRQVLINLLSNAVKFTPEGGKINLTVREQPGEGPETEYFFSVRDNGVGIASGYQDKIFDSFEQVGSHYAKSMGTGLGLPISRSIVQAMGGELKLKSASGEGSEFFFTLRFPVAKETLAPDVHKPMDESLKGVRVLLAEDNDLNAEIARELMGMRGIETLRASNGREAVDLFTGSVPGRFHLILMDVRMPVMDGLEATRQIRASTHPDAARIPILAMTANSFKEDERAAYQAGMTGFLPKPMEIDRLCQAIRDSLWREI